MIAFSGVRSSWDMFARNCDLCWLATSARGSSPGPARTGGRSRSPGTDWLANVWSRSTTSAGTRRASCGGSPARRRPRCSRTSGTASSARSRLAQRTADRRSSPSLQVARPRRLDRTRPRARRPPRPTTFAERWRRRLDRGQQAGGMRYVASGTPSAPSRRPARRRCRRRRPTGGRRATTIVVSTSWRSSDEETAWLTSPSACSSSRASCRALLQLLEQAGVLDGDDGLVGERLQQRDLLLGERPTSQRCIDQHADRLCRSRAAARRW